MMEKGLQAGLVAADLAANASLAAMALPVRVTAAAMQVGGQAVEAGSGLQTASMC